MPERCLFGRILYTIFVIVNPSSANSLSTLSRVGPSMSTIYIHVFSTAAFGTSDVVERSVGGIILYTLFILFGELEKSLSLCAQ